jgi:c-di-GMP-binding flagellar brake protein YcgR
MKSHPSAADRRCARRHEGRWPVSLRRDGQRFQSQCANLSITGMGLDTVGSLPVGSVVDAWIQLKPSLALQLTAEVVHNRHGQRLMGLRFVRIDADVLMALHQFLATKN